MAIVVLTSVSGSPGVTSLAVGLALAWPRSVLLADCDPGAHQAVLAGFLTGQSSGGKGLLRIAEAHRDRRPLREVILDQTLPLTDDDDQRRKFLPGFSRPGSAGLFARVWGDFVEAFDQLDQIGIDVVVDAGRLGPAGLPEPLAEAAGFIGLVVQSSLRSVVSAQVHLPALLLERDQAADARFGLVVVGEGRPYSAQEMEGVLGLRAVVSIPYDPVAAGHLSDGRTRTRKFAASAFARALHTTATDLSGRLQARTELIGSRS
jgi:hypothetical protein